jgi:hypothetical protein
MPFSKDDTTKPIPFRLVDDLDAKTGLTGKAGSISVEVSKAGSSVFSSGGGSVGEIGKGWYEYTPTASEMDTAGFAQLYADDAAAAAPADVAFSVVDNDVWGVYRSDNRDGNKTATESGLQTLLSRLTSSRAQNLDDLGTVDGLSFADLRILMAAFGWNLNSVTDIGGGSRRVELRKKDGMTAAVTVDYDPANGERTSSTIHI